MKLIDKFNEFCAKQTEKKNQKLLEKYRHAKEDATTAGVFALVAIVFPPALLATLHYGEKEQRLRKKLQKRGIQVPQ